MIGLKRGTVELCAHEKEWENEARQTILRLTKIFGNAAKDIRHVGSTSVSSIKAKPIIDIAVAVESFDVLPPLVSQLKIAGFYYLPANDMPWQRLLACGSFYDGSGDLQTHFVHVVLTGSKEWNDYINFRNYLIKYPAVAAEYEKLKLSLAAAAPVDAGRKKYMSGKHNFIIYTLRKALADSYLGKTVKVKIDRPVGYIHQKEKYTITYPINYGHIPGVIGGDGEELDVYVLGVSEPLTEFTGKIIGIVHRENDCEDKLIAAPERIIISRPEAENSVRFQEQYYMSRIEMQYGE